MRVIDAGLTLRSGTDGSIQRAGRNVVFALQRIAKEQVILDGPVASRSAPCSTDR